MNKDLLLLKLGLQHSHKNPLLSNLDLLQLYKDLLLPDSSLLQLHKYLLRQNLCLSQFNQALSHTKTYSPFPKASSMHCSNSGVPSECCDKQICVASFSACEPLHAINPPQRTRKIRAQLRLRRLFIQYWVFLSSTSIIRLSLSASGCVVKKVTDFATQQTG